MNRRRIILRIETAATAALGFAAVFPIWSAPPSPAGPAGDSTTGLERVAQNESRETAPERLYYASRPAAGTLFMVRCWSSQQALDVERNIQRAFETMKRWEMILSERDARSELARFNNAPDGVPVPISPELETALLQALEMARRTDGRFDPTLGPLVRLWRREASTGRRAGEEEIERARTASGWNKLVVGQGYAVKTVPGMRIDLGGIGKGIMLDRMADTLRERGITRFLLADTSDMLAGDPPPGQLSWNVRSGETTVALHREALSTSGGDFQHTVVAGAPSVHIIDPTTGRGRPMKPAATVRARTAAEADALATASYARAETETTEKAKK